MPDIPFSQALSAEAYTADFILCCAFYWFDCSVTSASVSGLGLLQAHLGPLQPRL